MFFETVDVSALMLVSRVKPKPKLTDGNIQMIASVGTAVRLSKMLITNSSDDKKFFPLVINISYERTQV